MVLPLLPVCPILLVFFFMAVCHELYCLRCNINALEPKISSTKHLKNEALYRIECINRTSLRLNRADLV